MMRLSDTLFEAETLEIYQIGEKSDTSRQISHRNNNRNLKGSDVLKGQPRFLRWLLVNIQIS